VHLDVTLIEVKTLIRVGEELKNVAALIALELDNLTQLLVDDSGAVAGCFVSIGIVGARKRGRAYQTSS
jgi:hypothetical protein